MSKRVALLTNIPTPYRLPWYEELSRHCDLLVVFDDHAERNRKWTIPEEKLAFPHVFAGGTTITYRRKRRDIGLEDERYLQVRYGIVPALRKFKPDAIVSTEMGPRTLQALAYSQIAGVPLIIWWEGTPHTEGWVGKGKVAVRKLLVRKAKRFWSNGAESTALLRDYGASPDDVDEGMTGVETEVYARKTKDFLPERSRLRSEMGLEGVVFLFVGQLVERKGIDHYLKALGELYDSGLRGWSAVFVGSGPLDGKLRDWRAEHPDVPVVASGFVQPDELPKFYAIGDVFVLPTLDDNWSLVVLEAAAAGLPQLFSVYNGGTSDLLSDERMGRAIDPFKTPQFVANLEHYVRNPPARLPDEQVRRLVDYYGPQRLAERSWRSVEKALR